MGIFKRSECGGAFAALGSDAVALHVGPPCTVPPGCVGVACDRQGVTHRIAEGARIDPGAGAAAWCFHPGPYTVDLVPFEAAPEAGIRLAYVVDSADPRVGQQRFDLLLASECGERLGAAQLGLSIESALRRELAQGNLELPPCATLAEWDAFRAGFDELLYTRFGLTVENCAPADLAGVRDYAAMLLAAVAAPACAEAPPAPAAPVLQAADDARALRRLFLELPRITSGLRMAQPPAGLGQFQRHQELLQRLGHAGMSAATMPTLDLAAPGRMLDARQQARRIAHSMRAAASLDEAWALLGRINGTSPLAILDDAERIVANLEHDCAARRAVEGDAA